MHSKFTLFFSSFLLCAFRPTDRRGAVRRGTLSRSDSQCYTSRRRNEVDEGRSRYLRERKTQRPFLILILDGFAKTARGYLSLNPGPDVSPHRETLPAPLSTPTTRFNFPYGGLLFPVPSCLVIGSASTLSSELMLSRAGCGERSEVVCTENEALYSPYDE